MPHRFLVAFQCVRHSFVEADIIQKTKVEDVVSEIILSQALHISSSDPRNSSHTNGESNENKQRDRRKGDEYNEGHQVAVKIQVDYSKLCAEDWILRMIKNVRRNRIVEVQAMIDQGEEKFISKGVFERTVVAGW
jgi:hypothetical protein